ncbi:MAG TPA: MFS transporter [Streptosporangiaceae bacterium]
MPALLLACLAYLSVALPSSAFGLLWPSMRLSFGTPVGALGIILVPGIIASVIASAVTGRARIRTGTLVAAATGLIALALAAEAAAPSLGVLITGTVLFGVGFGTLDTALNAHAARHFGARDINWMHASYGLGATIGPLLVTALLAGGRSWRLVYAVMAAALVVLGGLLALARHGWTSPAPRASAQAPPDLGSPAPGSPASPSPVPSSPVPPAPSLGADPVNRSAVAAARVLTFTAVETGLESAAGIWGYLFLTAGRGLPAAAAGLAVSAYWATMCAGRVVLGPVAQRLGPARVLAAAVAGVPLGAALMALPISGPGSGALAVAGLMVLGLAAAPVFPLVTLTTGTTRMVGLQVAASAAGTAALPAVLGLAIGAAGARVLGPFLLALSLAMAALFLSGRRRAAPAVTPPA